ncbi:type II toxin-antitoxin system VapC family toxin [Bosea sp. PAMC 26642]|uniref:type II toxin-antitoxin system VapC family toxin n=1 Tax=Bosea sp. (strain PAMC 26642) TaxID=1792307 RepID=UPI000770129D|nr:type II toxin-antitoxin system VapC family toxin [Bosea sp. PAMC 26642]AMJ58972.1 recombinase [Bosea sp. PAMC 26642]
MTFLLDTNVVSEPQKPRPAAAVERFFRETPERNLYVSVVTTAELYRGLALMTPGHRHFALSRWITEALPRRFGGRLLPVTVSIAARWGDIMAHSHRTGLNMSIMDGFLAATAAEHDLTLATRNVRHFADLGVPVFNPWDEA